MALITWSPAISVNIDEIDSQHQKLIGLLNGLHDSMINRESEDIMHSTLIELAEYAIIHFETEEIYFEKYNYPHAESHILEHKYFVNKIDAFIKEYESQKALITIDLMRFVADWVVKHVKGTDKKYTKFFNENGLV